jgi:hypothetical protein
LAKSTNYEAPFFSAKSSIILDPTAVVTHECPNKWNSQDQSELIPSPWLYLMKVWGGGMFCLFVKYFKNYFNVA